MNAFVDEVFAEDSKRLALGLEPIDAERQLRTAHPIQITFDQALQGLSRPAIERHDSCLHALRYFGTSDNRVEMTIYDDKMRRAPRTVGYPLPASLAIDLRLFDNARRFVPRRLRFSLQTATAADALPFTPAKRMRRPVLFPGAAYDISERATGLRARVLRDGKRMRWTRVEATLPGSGALVGRAHGDDRGEFLLLLGTEASPLSDLENPLQVRVTVYGPKDAPIPSSPEQPTLDPLWDLPLEIASAPGTPDAVSAGEVLPDDPGDPDHKYVATPTSVRDINFVMGRLSTGVPDFIFS